METTLTALRDGRSCHTVYDTRFFIRWPESLGGGDVEIDFTGSMELVPLFGTG